MPELTPVTREYLIEKHLFGKPCAVFSDTVYVINSSKVYIPIFKDDRFRGIRYDDHILVLMYTGSDYGTGDVIVQSDLVDEPLCTLEFKEL